PEGWEEAIKRMVRLNGLTLEPAEARSILKYLATYHGLAPEEAKPLMYFPEHRIQDEAIPNETIRTTCSNCHALGKALSWRRSKEDWKLLTNMHVAFFPRAEAGQKGIQDHNQTKSLKDGSQITRTGMSLVYSGYAWRGRSHSAAIPAKAAPDDPNQEVREVMWISPDQTFADGRWFWGYYQ